MTHDRFVAILEIKVSGLVEELMQAKPMTLEDALACVYRSQVYDVLQREDTKLWHHSPKLLLECLESEIETGVPAFPDE